MKTKLKHIKLRYFLIAGFTFVFNAVGFSQDLNTSGVEMGLQKSQKLNAEENTSKTKTSSKKVEKSSFSFKKESLGDDIIKTNSINDANKLKWIDSNSENYIRLGGRLSDEKNIVQRNLIPLSDVVIKDERMPEYTPLPQYSSFPKYYNTGDKLQDDENYRQKKDLWIQQNTSLYNSMNQTSKNKVNDNRIKTNNN